MPNTPNTSTSFIPRRGPVKRSSQNNSRQVYVFTTLSYVIFSATLIATVGLFFYDRHVKEQLKQEVAALDSAISIFSEADMEQVRELDLRLIQVKNRVDNSVSIVSIFTALEEIVVKSAQLIGLTIERQDDSGLRVNASVRTDSFDSTYFQRTLLARSDIFKGISVEELKIGGADDGTESVSSEKVISFEVKAFVPLSAIPYVPDQEGIVGGTFQAEEILAVIPETSTSSIQEPQDTSASSSNQNSL